MADEVINIEYNIDASGGKKNMKELNREIEKNVNSIGSLEQRSEELKDSLKGVEIGTQEFKELAAELQSVESQLKDVELQFEALDFEQRLTAATDVATGLAGGFAAVQGAIAVAGVESEEFEETLLKVQGAMAIAMGVRDIGLAISALQKLNVVTKIATAAQKVFNLILSLNPIGIIIIAVTALVAALALIPNAIERVVEWFDNLGKGAKIAAMILGGPFIAAVIAAREIVKLFRDEESEAEIAAAKAARDRRKRILQEIKDLEELSKETKKLNDERKKASDERLDALDFELRKAQATGQGVVEAERAKIEATIAASEERIKALEEELRIETAIAKKRLELNESTFRAFGKSFQDKFAKDTLENVKALEEELEEVRKIRKDSEEGLTIFELKEQKKRTDAARKAADERRKVEEREAEERRREQEKLEEYRQAQREFEENREREQRERARAEREAEGERLLQQAALLDELRIENIEDQFERERELRKAEFDNKIVELQQQGLLTNEIETELRKQLNKDLADIDSQAEQEALKRKQDTQNAIIEIERAAFSISESLIALAINNEQKADKARRILAGAQLAVDTAKAISGAVAQAQSVPFPGNLAAIATGVATVLANIAKAKELLQSSGVQNLPSLSGAAGGGGAPRINALTAGSTLIPNTQPNSKVFVVESDITDTQNRVKTIETQSRI